MCEFDPVFLYFGTDLVSAVLGNKTSAAEVHFELGFEEVRVTEE